MNGLTQARYYVERQVFKGCIALQAIPNKGDKNFESLWGVLHEKRTDFSLPKSQFT